MIYKFTENEFRFLLVFSGIPMLTPDDLTDPSLIEDAEGTMKSLEEKEYLFSEDGKYFLPDKLNFFLNVMRDPFAILHLRGREKKMWIFFKEDALILLTQDPDYEIIWIPFMHLLVGATATFMAPYLNADTSDIRTYRLDELESVRQILKESGQQKQFEAIIYSRQNSDKLPIYETYSNSESQYLVRSEGEEMLVSRASKEDIVNGLTRITAHMHADAIKEVIPTDSFLE